MIQIALLGFGTVGSGVAEVFEKNAAEISRHCGQEVRIKYILDLREFPNHPLGNRVVHDVAPILADKEVSVVAEMMGGSHPAVDFTRAALEAGKSVVTSNKEVVANFGTELLELASKHGVSYLFEASVGGGIPIIRPMQVDLASNKILSVNGILNGTTNYILTRMKSGASFDAALKEAQANGFAEANPTADVEGIDAARKIVILSALAFGVLQNPDTVARQGITGISDAQSAAAEKFGFAIKLVGHAELVGGKLLNLVAPHMVPVCNPLHHITGVNNGILLNCNMLGGVLFSGPGAGKLPTAGAVAADILDIVTNAERTKKAPAWKNAAASDLADASLYAPSYVVGITGCHKCAEKAKAALGTDRLEFVTEDSFALVTPKMTSNQIASALSAAGLTADFALPVV